jgi:hypothetical protein
MTETSQERHDYDINLDIRECHVKPWWLTIITIIVLKPLEVPVY